MIFICNYVVSDITFTSMKDGVYSVKDGTFTKILNAASSILDIHNLNVSDYESLEYARLRAVEYEKLNQNELRFDDLENNTKNWQLAINKIKAKYPKPKDIND